jgi:PAS domain S-box-containing protein
MKTSPKKTTGQPKDAAKAGHSKLLRLLESSGLRRLLDGSPYPALAYDQRRTIEYFNPAAEQYYGYRMDELVGVTPKVLLGQSISRTLFQEIATRIYGENSIWLGRLPQRRRDGRQAERFVGVFPLRPDGRMRPLPTSASIASRARRWRCWAG